MKVPSYECKIYSNFFGGKNGLLGSIYWNRISECQDSTNGPNRPHFQGVKEVSLHSTPKTLQILWPLGISVSPKSFIKSKIFPEAASFKVFDNGPALPTCWTKGCGKSLRKKKKTILTPKGDIPFSSQVSKQSVNTFNNIFSRQRSFVPKECLCSNSQLSNCRNPKRSVVLHQKEHWDVQLLLVHVKST